MKILIEIEYIYRLRVIDAWFVKAYQYICYSKYIIEDKENKGI